MELHSERGREVAEHLFAAFQSSGIWTYVNSLDIKKWS